jgi:NADPH:quinone reductase-like Zn-dependent oxidoreductase
MKAAVLNQLGTIPVYQDYPEPVPQNDEQIVINVKAAAIKNIDKLRTNASFYACHTNLPTVVGIDGVGVLENGTRVYAQGITGMIAEKALISKHRYTVLPEKLDYSTAAALPNAALGGAASLLLRGNMQKGNTVLINGATGVTGQFAIQVAKYYGAAKIIVTGRNPQLSEKLKTLGADTFISLQQDDEAIIRQLRESHAAHPVDIVIDYLWGHPIELIISAVKGGGMNTFTHKVRIVTVGDMAGSTITLPSAVLRSSAIEILGSGIGSLSQEDLKKFASGILPEIFQLAADGRLTINTKTETLENIQSAWNENGEAGERIVISMN